MDFYIDLGAAVMFRILKDRRSIQKYRGLFIKLAAAIQTAFAADASFANDVAAKVSKG